MDGLFFASQPEVASHAGEVNWVHMVELVQCISSVGSCGSREGSTSSNESHALGLCVVDVATNFPACHSISGAYALILSSTVSLFSGPAPPYAHPLVRRFGVIPTLYPISCTLCRVSRRKIKGVPCTILK